MAKRYKHSQADTSPFHVGLIKMCMVYEMGLRRDSWDNFLSCNSFVVSKPPQVDKPMVTESKPTPVPYSVLLPKPLPDSPTSLPVAMISKPTVNRPKAKAGVNAKCKKKSRLISRIARNKSKTSANADPIVVSESSDSEIKRFLADEYPYSEGLCDKPACDFVNNLPPCLKGNPKFPGIKLTQRTLSESLKTPDAPCDQCGLWLERYYTDVPIFQTRIRDLENQVVNLTGHEAKVQPSNKKQRTTGSILFKNVESATAIVNSKLA
jgi:hypothetical protein